MKKKVKTKEVEVKEEEEKGTLDYALDLVGSETGRTFEDYKVKSLGLQIALVGLGEFQAKRLQGITKVIDILEERIFNVKTIGDLRANDLIFLYKLVQDNLTKATDYISNMMLKLDWNRLETNLLSLSTTTDRLDKNQDKELTGITEKILKQMATMKMQEIESNPEPKPKVKPKAKK